MARFRREKPGEEQARRALPEAPPGAPEDAVILSFPVPPELAGLRLDRFIQRRIPRLSRTRANAIVRACARHSDGRRRRPGERVRAGETVILVRERFEEPETPKEFGVLYEDEALMVIDKPAGLPVHPSATYHKNTLTYMLRERYGAEAPQIAHRLDRETSGVLVCAKTLADERRLKLGFEERRFKKSYLAIARGRLEPEEGRIELPMGRPSEGLHLLMEIQEGGAPARTRYRVEEAHARASMVALWPETGRQHQLRVHLAALGHPIVGDKLYGPAGTEPFFRYIDEGMSPELVAVLGHERHALHARTLTLEHPRSGEEVTFEAPLPPDLRALWARLGEAPSAGEPAAGSGN